MPRLMLLGPMQVQLDAGAVSLAIRKTQALLLLLADGEPVPRSRVCALLWPDLADGIARRNLRRELARLRDACPAPLLHAEGDLLSLAVGVHTDRREFEQALQRGDADDALALWRGPLADGLKLADSPPFEEWLAAERERAGALRRRALEASAAAHEARGRVVEALDRVQALLAEDALQEHRHRDAMRLLAACGRREAALTQFEHCRRLLEDELGLEPMAETVALCQRLREAGAAPLAMPHAVATKAPTVRAGHASCQLADKLAAPLPFAGRSAELQQLQSAWAQGRSLLVGGAGGVGKSRLAVDFAAAQGPYLLVHARPGDADTAYASFAMAMRSLVGPARDHPALAPLAPWVRRELARLLPELDAAPEEPRSEADPLRFTEACALAWAALTGGDFDTVVFDDWHLADAPSRALLLHIAARRREPGARTPGPCELIVFRPAEPGSAFAEWLVRWREACPSCEIGLEPLAEEAVLGIVQQLSGVQRPTRFASRLARATGGNPFFLSETLRYLAEQGLLNVDAEGQWCTPFDADTVDYNEMPLPASVREAVQQRVARLGAACQRVLEAASLASQPFQPALLAPACALSEIDALLAVEQAQQAQLLREHEAGGFAFAHDLVQQAVEAALPAQRRRLVHHRLALAAQSLGAAPAVTALHFEAAAQPARAVAHRLAAGRAAAALHANDDALVHWQQGLADGPTREQEAELRMELMRTLRRIDRRDALDAQLQALMPFWRDETLALELRARIATALAQSLAAEPYAQQGMALLDSLPPALVAPVHAELLTLRIDMLVNLGRFEEALALGDEASSQSLQGQPPRVCFERHRSLAMTAFSLGRTALASAQAELMLAAARTLNDDASLAYALVTAGVASVEQGGWRAAIANLREAAEVARRTGYQRVLRMALFNQCCAFSAMGQPHEVRAAALEGLALPASSADDPLTTLFHSALIEAHAAGGELGLGLQAVEQALERAEAEGYRGMISLLSTAFELLNITGNAEMAERPLARLAQDKFRPNQDTEAEFWLVQAEAALLNDAVTQAEARLAQVPPPGEIGVARVAHRARITTASLALARGEAEAALAGLPADEAEGMNDEMRMRKHTVRLRALVADGTLNMAALEGAQALLKQAAPAQVLAALQLHHALREAARAMPAASKGLRLWCEGAHGAYLERLAASLAEHPRERAWLIKRWG